MIAKSLDDMAEYLDGADLTPLLVQGDARRVLGALPDSCIDCSVTSPPYYRMREYAAGGIGLEDTWQSYVDDLVAVCSELHRVLKPTGSLWLNIGDSYLNKSLLMVPERVAARLTDEVGFTLRNHVVWNKVKGAPDNAKDRMRTVWESVFFLTKSAGGYYYDIDAVRLPPRKALSTKRGAVVSATGVSGVRYRRKIELSTVLSDEEKPVALSALDDMLELVASGEVPDFRMVIRGATRATHGDSARLSGRAKELAEKGFYFLKYSKKGANISDVWDILPEDTQGRKTHYAPFPEDLVKTPIALTCPPGGVVLDPFCGLGTTSVVARDMGRRSIGIDLAPEYLVLAEERLGQGRQPQP